MHRWEYVLNQLGSASYQDYMLLMGLRESIYWLSWIITYAVMAVITVFVVVRSFETAYRNYHFVAESCEYWQVLFVQVIAAKVTYLFEFSSAFALFIIIFAYSLSLITMAFALSTMFSKVSSISYSDFLPFIMMNWCPGLIFCFYWIVQSRTAVSVSVLLMVLFSLAVIPIELLHLSTPVCAVLALFSPAGFAMATNVIVRAEGRGRGIHILGGQRNFRSRVAPSASLYLIVLLSV